MSIAGAIEQLLRVDDHELAQIVIEFDRKRREQTKLTTGKQLHLSSAVEHRVNRQKPLIRSTTEIRRVLEKIFGKYKPGWQISSYDLYKELERFHIENNFFTEKDLTLDSEGKQLWKHRASNALQQMVKAGAITKISGKMYKIEVW